MMLQLTGEFCSIFREKDLGLAIETSINRSRFRLSMKRNPRPALRKDRIEHKHKRLPVDDRCNTQALGLPWPDCAPLHIFAETRTVAWEGRVKPMAKLRVYPEKSFLSNIVTGADSTWIDHVHPLDKGRVSRHFSSIQGEQIPCSIDYRLIRNDGSQLWVRHSITWVGNNRRSLLAQGFITDIQAEKEFQLESLRVSEREQNRIGQDLHDDLCQVLAGVSCLMRVLEGRIGEKLPSETSYLKEINQQVVEAMHRTRALTHGLFPGKVQLSDIRGSLLELATQTRARFSIDIKTNFAGRFRKHSPEQIMQVYRIAQESLSNAIKHGLATQVDISLIARRNGVEMTVADNGSGLQKPSIPGGGVGLHIMQYRCGVLGGELAVANGKRGGVTVVLKYPFEN